MKLPRWLRRTPKPTTITMPTPLSIQILNADGAPIPGAKYTIQETATVTITAKTPGEPLAITHYPHRP
jgi:hypothetical protein